MTKRSAFPEPLTRLNDQTEIVSLKGQEFVAFTPMSEHQRKGIMANGFTLWADNQYHRLDDDRGLARYVAACVRNG
jgi:hypothetical protein